MIQRLRQAINKVSFCYTISADLNTFFSLLVNTKKSKKKVVAHKDGDDPVPYNFKITEQSKKISLRTYSGDIAMFYEIFWQKIYGVATEINITPQVIVDAGANIGMTSLFFSKYFPKATIYAIEPDADNFEILTENLSEEIHKGNLIPLKAAIADTDAEVFIEKRNYAYNSKVSETEETGNKVKAYSPHTLLREMMITQIDILKIDIEGMEEKIFSSETDWLKIVQLIIMECHSHSIEQLCRAKLVEYGFVLTKKGSLLVGKRGLANPVQ